MPLALMVPRNSEHGTPSLQGAQLADSAEDCGVIRPHNPRLARPSWSRLETQALPRVWALLSSSLWGSSSYPSHTYHGVCTIPTSCSHLDHLWQEGRQGSMRKVGGTQVFRVRVWEYWQLSGLGSLWLAISFPSWLVNEEHTLLGTQGEVWNLTEK